MERFAGRYGLLKLLGKGGMGEVHLAVDLDTGVQVAIKRLTTVNDERALAMVRGEFDALARVHHPAVVRVLELATDFEGRPYLVMEYVAGWAAQRVIRPGHFDELGYLAVRVAAGLEAIHAAGIAHGDIKPENLLVGTTDGGARLRDVKIVDFGFSGLSGAGTAGYSAPGVVNGDKAGPADDLYSFGATLFRLASGREPFEGASDDERLRRQMAGPPSSLLLEEADVPDGWIRLILQMLAVQPAERPRSATDVRRSIEQLSPSTRVPLADRIAGESLVGREAELARLEREWARARKGARTLVLTGESGIGKSALLDAFAARGVLESRSVVRVAGASSGAPGAVWRTVARRLAAEARVDLATDNSELHDGFRDGGGIPNDLEQARIGGAIKEWCQRISNDRKHPVCLLIDDADMLDEFSLRFLRRLMLAGSAAPALWVLARRSESGTDDAQEELMVAAGGASMIVVPPLQLDAVERLAAVRLGAEPGDDLLQFLWDRAAGHPGLTVESLRAAAASGAVRESETGILVDAQALAAQPLLPDFEATRLARVETLEESARRTATILAMYGRPVSIKILQSVDARVGAEALGVLRENGLALVDDERWSLRPAALATRIVESIPVEERRALHAAILGAGDLSEREKFHHLSGACRREEALATAEAAFIEAPEPDLAIEASRLAKSDPSLSARWLTRAARARMDRGRYRDAAPLLQQALSLNGDPTSRGERWGMLSTCRFRSGQLELLEQETELARHESLADGAKALLGLNEAARLSNQGRLTESLVAVREARALAEKSGDLGVLGMAMLTEAGALVQIGRLQDGSRLASESKSVSERAEHSLGIARASAMKAIVVALLGRIAEAESLFREARSIADKRGSRFGIEEIAGGHFDALVALGRWLEARSVGEEVLRLALEDGRGAGAALAMINLAQLDAFVGNIALARAEISRAKRLTRKHAPMYRAFAFRTWALVERVGGRTTRATRLAESGVRSARKLGSPTEIDWCSIELARARSRVGRWDEVGKLANEALATGSRTGTVADVAWAVFAGRASLRKGGDVREHLERIHSWPSASLSAYASALASQLRAEAALVGESDQAETLVDQSLQSFTELSASPEHALAALEFSRLAIECDYNSSSAIERWLDQALAGFAQVGDRHGCEQAASLGMRWFRALWKKQGGLGREQDLIGVVARLLDSLSDFNELTQRSMELAVGQLDAERGVLMLRDPATGELEVRAEHGAFDAASKRSAGEISRRAVERTLGSGDILLVDDASRDLITPSVMKFRIRSILCVPLFHGGQAIGAVYLDHTQKAGAFDDRDRQLMEGFANLMATAIANSRGADEVRRTNEELRDENLSLRREVEKTFRPEGFIGRSGAMSGVLAVVERAADLSTTVLVTGENGTGKERIARILHYSGRRRSGPFVAINCGAIPESLLESELFGFAEGAFTGAKRNHDGKFVQAHRGTLFLDEIGEMPINHQVRLLSVLESREVVPVGGSGVTKVDVRVIAATNRNLLELIDQGKFRDDLYQRLHVLPIEIPPLRDHKADIPDLARHFVGKFAELQERNVPELASDFIPTLMQSDWPGNIRELQNYIERVMALTPGDLLRPNPLPRDLESRGPALPKRGGLTDQMEAFERRILKETLDQCEWNQSKAARRLKMKEQTLRYRLKKYGLLGSRKNPRDRKKPH